MPQAVPAGFALGSSSPEDAIAAFTARDLLQPTFQWHDVWREEHAGAFMVAGVAKNDLLALFKAELAKAVASGSSLADFAKVIRPALQAKGFWGDVEVTDPASGETRITTFDDARLQLIYDTNLRQSYAAGRWASTQRNKKAQPFIIYRTMRDERVRASHAPWDGLVLPVDDAFWNEHYPPNGWRCRCRAYALSQRAVDRLRADGENIKTDRPPATTIGYRDPRTGETRQIPVGIDPGFDYNAGKARAERLGDLAHRAQVRADDNPPSLPEPPAPPPRVFKAQRTAKAAAEWAMENGLADQADYKGIDPEVANEWNRSLFDHLEEFPALRPAQKFVGTAQAQFALWREIAIKRDIEKLRGSWPGATDEQLRALAEKRVPSKTVKGTSWAQSWAQPDVSGIAVNRKWGADVEGFKASLFRNVESGFHPPGTDTIRSVVDHELGHQLDDLLSLSKDREVLQVYSQARLAGIKTELSGYAAKNIAEFIAEAWAEALNNPTPRPVAARIAAIIRKRYAEHFPT